MNFPQLQNKTVVITGVAGFIGSHLAHKVLAEGGRVIGVDNFITGNRKHIEELEASSNGNFTFIEADVSKDPQTYLANQSIDFVLHFASPASPPKYQAHPIETYLVNSIGTHLILEYLKTQHPKAVFLFASTSEVYGDPAVHPQPETYWGNVNPNGIRSCYDESKRLGESICGVFQRDFGCDVRIVRIFNTYGPRIDLEDGRVIPSLIRAVLNNTAFSIYGDGSQTRSFCYIDDLVNGVLALLTHPDGNGETVNVGNPGEFTILEALKVMESIQGQSLTTDFKPLPKDDPARRKPEITKAHTLLHWQPQVSFEDGLRKTLEYFQQ